LAGIRFDQAFDSESVSSPPDSVGRWTAATLLVSAVLLYLSLAPFWFHARPGLLEALSRSARNRIDWPDFLPNILVYLPFGACFARACLRVGQLITLLRGFRIVASALACSAILSLSIEIAQHYDHGRFSNILDVYANLIGAGIGAIFGIAFAQRPKPDRLV
jgi:glycopeptide antibiotics resistance protein